MSHLLSSVAKCGTSVKSVVKWVRYGGRDNGVIRVVQVLQVLSIVVEVLQVTLVIKCY